MLAFSFAFPFGAAGDDWKKRGDEDGTFCRVAWGVPCTDAGRDRRGAGEDIFRIEVDELMAAGKVPLSKREVLTRVVDAT